MQASWNEVDGVPTLSAAAGEIQGPLHGCLMFGTGRSRETLLTSGINHAIEHLVLHEINERAEYVLNGEVNNVTTNFWAFGRDDQVVDFFRAVARGLADLPIERLVAELRVLEIEGRRNRGRTHLTVDQSERFGPHGAGIVLWPEYGLDRFTDHELVEWTRVHFTAENAVLCLSRPAPNGLDLADLPRGPVPEPAEPPTAMVPGRSFLPSQTDRVSLSVLFRRRSGVNTVMQIAERRATERLRRDGLSYAVSYTPIDVCRGLSLASLEADGADENPIDVASTLLEIAQVLEAHGPEDHEVSRLRAFWSQLEEHPQHRMGLLDAVGRARLVDGEIFLPDHLDAIINAETPDSLRDSWREVMSTQMLIGPEKVRELLTEGWSVVTPWSSEQLGGRRFVAIPGRAQGTLVLGDAGATWMLEADRYRTIWWSDVEACLTLDSGSRGLIGAAGAEIWIVPWCWQGGEVLTDLVDAAVDPSRVVRVGEGSLSYEHEGLEGESDVRWLATILGARATWKAEESVSLVIDTDGLFVLHGAYRADDWERHQLEVRQADRDTLVRIDPRNRWIPQHEILRVELKQRPWTRAGMRSWALTIETVDGRRERVYLTRDHQLQAARINLPAVLGARFVV
jgi:hypothetical protein